MTSPPKTGYDALARYYELEYADYFTDIDFYLQLLRRTGGPLLDLACGTGRVSLAVADEGYEAVGVDCSEAMLAIARKKATGKVELVEGDLRTFDLGRRFPLVAVTLNSFMHLVEVEDQLAALRRIAQHLTADGRAVISTINPYSVSLHDIEAKLIHEFTNWDPETQSWVTKLSARDVDTVEQVEHVTYFYDEVKAGAVQRLVTTLDFRYTYRYELELLLRQGGLEPISVYGSYDLEPYEITSPALIVVAKVPA
ncbi:MAG TPA: class I SAM-dependent methyltransferase [Chloroflexota bacterium]|nr:class I SAM-dependent methyltransferase [Chloroflexota bacterium]